MLKSSWIKFVTVISFKVFSLKESFLFQETRTCFEEKESISQLGSVNSQLFEVCFKSVPLQLEQKRPSCMPCRIFKVHPLWLFHVHPIATSYCLRVSVLMCTESNQKVAFGHTVCATAFGVMDKKLYRFRQDWKSQKHPKNNPDAGIWNENYLKQILSIQAFDKTQNSLVEERSDKYEAGKAWVQVPQEKICGHCLLQPIYGNRKYFLQCWTGWWNFDNVSWKSMILQQHNDCLLAAYLRFDRFIIHR